MTNTKRVLLGLAGGAGLLVMVFELFIGFGMASLVNPSLPPTERCLIYLDRLFVQWPMPIMVSAAFVILNGCVWLCLKTRWPNHHQLRRLLLSSALAAIILVLLPLPFLIGLAQPR